MGDQTGTLQTALQGEISSYPLLPGENWYCLTHETFRCDVWGWHDVELRALPSE